MKISNKQLEQIQRLYGAQQRREQSAANRSVQRPDKVELSEESRTIEAARRAIESTPEVRQELVDRIKDAVDRGAYEVDSREVARKMIARIFADRL